VEGQLEKAGRPVPAPPVFELSSPFGLSRGDIPAAINEGEADQTSRRHNRWACTGRIRRRLLSHALRPNLKPGLPNLLRR